jgi:hypothetical protein
MIARRSDYYHGPLWKGQKLAFAKAVLNVTGRKDAHDVVRTCVREWSVFRDYAKKTSLRKVPDEPHIGALAGNATAAVEFFRRHGKAAAPASAAENDGVLTMTDLMHGFVTVKDLM